MFRKHGACHEFMTSVRPCPEMCLCPTMSHRHLQLSNPMSYTLCFEQRSRHCEHRSKFKQQRVGSFLPESGRRFSQTEARFLFGTDFPSCRQIKLLRPKVKYIQLCPHVWKPTRHLSIDHGCCFLLENVSSVQGVASYTAFGGHTRLNCPKPMKSSEVSGSH